MLSQHSWPPPALCPACHKEDWQKIEVKDETKLVKFDSYLCGDRCVERGVDWHMGEVYKFLCFFYGRAPTSDEPQLETTDVEISKVGLEEEIDSWLQASAKGRDYDWSWNLWLPPVCLLLLSLLAACCLQRGGGACPQWRSSCAAGSHEVAPMDVEVAAEETQRLITGNGDAMQADCSSETS